MCDLSKSSTSDTLKKKKGGGGPGYLKQENKFRDILPVHGPRVSYDAGHQQLHESSYEARSNIYMENSVNKSIKNESVCQESQTYLHAIFPFPA